MGIFQKIKALFVQVAVEPVKVLPVAVEEVAAVEDCVRDSGADEIRNSLVLLGYRESLVDLVLEGDLVKTDDYLSVYRYDATRVFNCAVRFTEKTKISRSDFLKVSAKYVADFPLIHDSFVLSAVRNLDVITAIEMVKQGVLGNRGYCERLLVDLSTHIDCHPRMADLLAAIIRHRPSLDFGRMLYMALGNMASVHRLSKIMRNNGYDFSGCEPVTVAPFLLSVIDHDDFEPGVISDLLAWGLRIEDPENYYLSSQFIQESKSKYKPILHSIVNEMLEGERRNNERQAANITQTLAVAGLTQDDGPKPKRMI